MDLSHELCGVGKLLTSLSLPFCPSLSLFLSHSGSLQAYKMLMLIYCKIVRSDAETSGWEPLYHGDSSKWDN